MVHGGFSKPSIMAERGLGLRALGAFCPKTSQGIPGNLGPEGMSVLRNETWILSTEPQIKDDSRISI